MSIINTSHFRYDQIEKLFHYLDCSVILASRNGPKLIIYFKLIQISAVAFIHSPILHFLYAVRLYVVYK